MNKTSEIHQFSTKILHLIKARYPLIHLETFEEGRILGLVNLLNKGRDSSLYVWSRTEGVVKNGNPVASVIDPMAILSWYEDLDEKSILVLKDYHPYIKDPGITRKLRDLGHKFKKIHKNIIFVSPQMTIPMELAKEVAVLEVPLPTRHEISEIVNKAAAIIKLDTKKDTEETNRLIDASTGLTHDEIENVLAKSIVSEGKLDHKIIQQDKSEIVKRSGVLEFVEVRKDVKIGGLQNLKHWLKIREKGLKEEAREIGLPAPKGMLLVGVPGCGKSLTATTISQEWKLPLLRLDMGRVFSGLVGSSESNMRQAIQTAEAVAPCILWIDEIEKGLAGSGGSGDGGTTSRVFGTVLTWMQEKKSLVFVMATANNISQLPPEFLRKGRFDEIFYVDLPGPKERNEIFSIHLKRYGWDVENLELDVLVEKSKNFSGAEIEQSLVEARYAALNEETKFSQAHIVEAIKSTVPLSKTMGEQIDHLRRWAQDRARPASIAEEGISSDSFEARTSSMEIS